MNRKTQQGRQIGCELFSVLSEVKTTKPATDSNAVNGVPASPTPVGQKVKLFFFLMSQFLGHPEMVLVQLNASSYCLSSPFHSLGLDVTITSAVLGFFLDLQHIRANHLERGGADAC